MELKETKFGNCSCLKQTNNNKKHAVKLPVANATEKSRCLQLNENKPSIYCFNFNSFLDTCDT